MTNRSLQKALALGALTGMRSMAGPATLAYHRGGLARHVFTLLAAGEMLADKTPLVPDRIAPLPLAGRAALGAVVGGIVAYDAHDNVVLGGLIGAAAAVATAHLAYRIRTRLPVSNAVGGMIEDALVARVASMYV
jgi:uncharacterized membrane protein